MAGTLLVGPEGSPPPVLGAFYSPEPWTPTITTGGPRTFYVYLCNGAVEAISQCKSMKLNGSEMVVRLSDDSTRRFRRTDVYFASWGQVTPPVMF
jgi:hypothetical protein